MALDIRIRHPDLQFQLSVVECDHKTCLWWKLRKSLVEEAMDVRVVEAAVIIGAGGGGWQGGGGYDR